MLFPPIAVTFTGGRTHTATPNVPDIVAFERKFGTLSIAMNAPGLEHLAYLAYVTLRRAGKAGDDFDQWLNDVDELELLAQPDPTEPVPAEA